MDSDKDTERIGAARKEKAMEFNEKLQELRKQKGLTQEELAQHLYVSRTAVSKWESGRGYPSIESLKAIAKYFSVSIDELLSGDEVQAIADEERRQKSMRHRGKVFSLLDCCAAMLLFLPLFRQQTEGVVYAASLLTLSGIAPYLKAAYFAVVIGMTALGVLTYVLQSTEGEFWRKNAVQLSLRLNAGGLLLFIISPQPYAAVLLFVFLLIKVFLLAKSR